MTRSAAAIGAALLIAASALFVATPAQAHDELVSSDPASGSTAETLPTQLTLTFSGVLAGDAGASEVAVTDAAGTSLTGGAPVVADTVLTQPLAGEASGVVTVLWKVVSSDGHPISGEYSFTVTGAPEPAPTVTPTPTPSATLAPTQEPTAEATTTAPEDPNMEALDTRPWFVGALLLLLAVAGAVMYLLISRGRREAALGTGPDTPADPSGSAPASGPAEGSEPGSDPSAER